MLFFRNKEKKKTNFHKESILDSFLDKLLVPRDETNIDLRYYNNNFELLKRYDLSKIDDINTRVYIEEGKEIANMFIQEGTKRSTFFGTGPFNLVSGKTYIIGTNRKTGKTYLYLIDNKSGLAQPKKVSQINFNPGIFMGIVVEDVEISIYRLGNHTVKISEQMIKDDNKTKEGNQYGYPSINTKF